jgi:hypothetical protein
MIRPRFWTIFFIVLLTLFLGSVTADALTVYQYTDKNGTVCFVQDPNQIPPEYREDVKKIELKERKDASEKSGDVDTVKEGAGRKEAVKEKITDLKQKGRELKETGEKEIARGFELVSSFLRDQRSCLIVYAVGGVILFIIVSVVLKKYLDNFVLRLFIKMVIVFTFLAVGYLFYMSYMSEQLSFFDQQRTNYTGSDSKEGHRKLVTPRQIVDRAKDAADEMNRRTKQSEEMLKE